MEGSKKLIDTYDSFDFSFVNNLLSKIQSEEYDSSTSISMANNILKCLSHITPLAETSRMLKTLPVLNQVILKAISCESYASDEELQSIVVDSLEVIKNLSLTQNGVCALLNESENEDLFKMFQRIIDDLLHGWQIVIQIIRNVHEIGLKSPSALLNSFMIYLVQSAFPEKPTMKTFKLVKELKSLIDVCDGKMMNDFLERFMRGLFGMLVSKLGKKEKRLAIECSCKVITKLGVRHFLGKNKNDPDQNNGDKEEEEDEDEEEEEDVHEDDGDDDNDIHYRFCDLTLRLAAIEVQLCLEVNVDEMTGDNSSVLASSCYLFEDSLRACMERGRTMKNVGKVKDILFEVVFIMFRYLSRYSERAFTEENLTPQLLMTIKFISVFISYKKLAFDEDVLDLLPILLDICNVMYRKELNLGMQKILKDKMKCKCLSKMADGDNENINNPDTTTTNTDSNDHCNADNTNNTNAKSGDSLKNPKTQQCQHQEQEQKNSETTTATTNAEGKFFNDKYNIFRLLLLGFSHISHIDEAREVMMRKKFLELIVNYFIHLSNERLRSDDEGDAEGDANDDKGIMMDLICDILCNFILMKGNRCKEPIYARIGSAVMHFLADCREYGEVSYDYLTVCVSLLNKTNFITDVDGACLKKFIESFESNFKKEKMAQSETYRQFIKASKVCTNNHPELQCLLAYQ